LLIAGVAAWSSRADWPVAYRQRWLRCLSEYLPVAAPILILGFLVGYTTGISRLPIAGALLTATLAAIGGLAAHAFGKDAAYRGVVAVAVLVFALNVFIGLSIGSLKREDERVERHKRLATQEFHIRLIRQRLGLGPEPPAWMLTGEPQAGK
jgi:hypothetical protein